MSTINAANVQVGQSSTPANNITLSTSTSGDLVVSKGASGALVEITRIKNNGELAYTPAGTGAVATTVQSQLRRQSVCFNNFIPDGTDTANTDCSPYIQAAIDTACPIYGPGIEAGKVWGIPGNYRIDTTLNATSSRVPGTRSRDGLHISGDGVRFLGNTGADKAIIETTGSQFLIIDKGVILQTNWTLSSLPTKSTIGVFSGCSAILPQTQNQTIACRIWMHNESTANSGVGTVALWNFGAEENTYETPHWFANVAAVLTSSNDGNQPGAFSYASYQAPLLTSHSLGMTTFSGEAFLCGHGRKGAPLILQNVTSVHFANTYISDVDPTGGTNIYGMHLLGNASTITGKLLFETYSSILFQGSLISSDLNITWGGVLATSSPALSLDRAFSSGIINSNLVVDLQANTSRPILSTTDGNEVSACSYYIQRSSITGRALGAPVLYIPLNVASNSSSLDISIIGANANPTQPAFSAYYAADAANVTGDGTVFSLNGYTCVALTNANNSFNTSNGKFSAPQNGNYTFEASLMFYGVGAAHTDAQLFLQAGGVSYQLQRDNPYPTSVGTTATFSGSITIPMLATQEAYLTLVVGGGAKTISIGNGATLFNSRFSGGRVY